MQVKWSVTSTDRLGPEILTVSEIKGQVLHRVRLHVKVPGWLLNLNTLLNKKLPKFLPRLSSLKSSNSEGVDGINVNVIKASIDLLASPLSQMCNISFSTGIVPGKLNISKVIPMFKSEHSTNFTNYRPISILPCFSKILESAMHRPLRDYLTKHSIINNCQYGFRKKHSTFMAILELSNKIFDSFEKNELPIGISIDLEKAFNT